MGGFILQAGTGSVSIGHDGPLADKVLSLFGESLRLTPAEDLSGSDHQIELKQANSNFDPWDFKNKVVRRKGNRIDLELDPEQVPRILKRDGSPGKKRDGSIDLLTEEEWFWRQLSRLSSLAISCFSHRGGFLIHSGLTEFRPPDGRAGRRGILLAGASGSGKSTASSLFQSPWYSLADDLTLVIRKSNGEYSAHPLPTWSRVLWKEDKVKFKTVRFDSPVDLTHVIFIDRGKERKLEKSGKGEALCLLTELVKQANEYLIQVMEGRDALEFNSRYFNNLNDFVRKVKLYSHNLKIDGSFWQEVRSLPEFST